jgi:hypothetical protein
MQEAEGRHSEVEGREHQARGYVESRNELISEITKEIGLDRMGEDAKAKDDDKDAGGDAIAPLLLWRHPQLLRHLLLPYLRRSSWRRTL